MKSQDLSIEHTSRRLKCKATSKRSGKRCERWAINGGVVCPFHGGAAPQVRRKAEEQLRLARDELMELLLGIARDASLSAGERLKAITWALERAGFKASSDVNVSMELPKWQQVLNNAAFSGEWDDGAGDAEEAQ